MPVPAVDEAHPPLRWRDILAPAAVFVCALGGTGVVTHLASESARDRARSSFLAASETAHHDLEARMTAYLETLRAAAALFHTHDARVDRATFRRFMSSLDLGRRYPGIRSVAWSPRVPHSDLGAFVATARREGLTDFRVWPEGERAVYQPVLYSHLANPRAASAVYGFDMATSESRRLAMERAAELGRPCMTGRIVLAPAHEPVGFLIFCPIFAADAPGDDAEGSRRLRGFVVSVFDAALLAQHLFARAPPRVSVSVHDGETIGGAPLLFKAGPPADPATANWTARRALDLAGRRWQVLYRGGPRVGTTAVNVALASGLLLSVLLGGLTWSESRSRARAEAAAARLRRSDGALRRAHAAKDEFLAMLGHELRNPLGALTQAVEVLRLTTPQDARIERCLDIAQRQLAIQKRLVDDLLDVARVSTGKISLRRAPLDLRMVAQSALDEARPDLEAREHHISLTAPPDPVPVEGDPVRLQQVVANLLSNAAKYTPPGGRVEVDVEAAADRGDALLRVRDTGLGIPPAKLEAIFDTFAQVGPARGERAGGLGLGLSLSRRLVEMHGGSLLARSEGPDRGSEFEVRLPLVVKRAGAGPCDGDGRRVGRSGGAGQRIVLVEDNPDVRESLRQLLELDGHEVHAAADGAAGADLIATLEPDVALVDLGLPGIDGCGVARCVRETLGPGPRLVALTGYGQEADRRAALAAGFDEYAVKPLDRAALSSLLETAPRRGAG